MKTPWMMHASPVTRVCFRGQRVHVKRDDIFHLAGNKMRKLYWFLQHEDTFYHNAHFVSFGGTQSNAMLAIAQLAAAKRVPFTYFSRALDADKSQLSQITSNLAAAKELGMRHVELETETYKELAATKRLPEYMQRLAPSIDFATKYIHIPQGAAFAQAEDGIRVLADELNEYCVSYERGGSFESSFSVVVPSGTGTTAFYLAQHLDPRIELFTVPCVGSSRYLLTQFDALAAEKELSNPRLPRILEPVFKVRFGQCSLPLYYLYKELHEATGIEFDLLYAAYTWQTLFDPLNLQHVLHTHTDKRPRELLYVHTGGVSGNSTMVDRYLRLIH